METRSKDLLVELKCSKEARARLDSAFKKTFGASGSVRHIILRFEVEIADIDPSTDAENVEKTERVSFDHGLELELKLSLTKRSSE